MRRMVALMGLLCAFTDVWGQGLLVFQNMATGFNAPLFLADGTTRAPAEGYSVELWVGGCPDSLSLVPDSMRTLSVPGYFFGPSVAVPGFPPGSRPWVQIRGWDNRGGTITNHAQAVASGDTNAISSAVWQLAGGLGDGTHVPAVTMAPLGSNPSDSRIYLTVSRCPEARELVLNVGYAEPGAVLTVEGSTNLGPAPGWQTLSVVTQRWWSEGPTLVRVPVSESGPPQFFRVAQ